MTITKEQFEKILEQQQLMQEICSDVDTSSITMWLCSVIIKDEDN